MNLLIFDEAAAKASLRRLLPADRTRMQTAYERIIATDNDARRRDHARRVLQLLDDVKREEGA